MITYRKATLEDVDWIIEILAKDMFSLLGEEDLPDTEYLKESFVPIIISTGVCMVAEQANTPIGCIGGNIYPTLFNPSKTNLIEFFWWVKEEYRGTSAGAKLLLLFEGVGIDRKVAYIVMSLMHNTNLNPQSLVKRGYINKETSFVRKI